MRSRRSVAIALAVVTLGLGLFALPQAQSATGTYGGAAHSELVGLEALTIPDTLQLARASVAPAEATVLSTGIPGSNGARSAARATNLDAELINKTVDAALLVEAVQAAPPDNAAPATDQLLAVPADPLLNATVATVSAHARWAGDEACVKAGDPIAAAHTELADAQVLTGTPAGTSVVAVHNNQGQTVATTSTVGLIDVAGQTTKGLRSVSTTQLTSIRLFEGSSNQININVLAPPIITATATGQPGGATVTYSEPILQIVDASGKVLGELNAASGNVQVDASPVAILRLGRLNSITKADGTSASGDAVLLEVIVGAAGSPIMPGVRLTIAGGSASASVPSGGVDCSGGGTATGTGTGTGAGLCGTDPLRELLVGSSTSIAVPGQSFNYVIVVSNRGNCTLDPVKIVSTIEGPPGTKVTATSPEASKVDGLTVTWDNIGPLAPGQQKILVITAVVPDGATPGAQLKDSVDATAKSGSETFTNYAEVIAPKVGDTGSGKCQLSQSTAGSDHKEVQPGETFTYYTNVLNSGGAPCPDVVVTMTIPPGVEFVSCNPPNCTVNGRVITWRIGTLNPGESRTLAATVKAPIGAATGKALPATVVITSGSVKTTLAIAGPKLTGNSILDPWRPAGAAVKGLRLGRLPVTGAPIAAVVALAMALVAAGVSLRSDLKARSIA